MPDNKTNPNVSTKLKQDWNGFLTYLDKKGVRGKPELDRWGYGYKLLDQYVKETPGTSLNRSTLPVIRQEILNYRNWALAEQKKPLAQRKVLLGADTNESNFMRHVIENEKTADPNYVGQHLSSTRFPESYLNTFLNNNLVKKENLGFATIKK